uniref:Multidrug resistance-associated protein 4-like n=1 Tax=Stegastes partitus TaxID=144197 RepID=A0A3B4ZXD9_9TELE
MEVAKTDSRNNPLATARILSRVFLCWLTPLLHLGHKRRLEESDMFSLLPEDRSETLGKELQRLWDQEVRRATKESEKPKLSRVLIKCYGKSYAVAGLFVFLQEAIKVIQPLLLGKIILFFEDYHPDDERSLYMAYGYAAAMSISTFALTILQHLYFYHVQRTGMKMRVAMCHMVYRKALGLNSESMGQTTTGQIVNLLSNDVSRFDEITINLHYLWLGPLQAIVIIVLLWYEIGPSCLAGVAVITLMMPLQTWFGKLFGIFRTVLYQILKSSYLRGLNMASFFASSKIIVFVTFTVYVVLDNTGVKNVKLHTLKCTFLLFLLGNFPVSCSPTSASHINVNDIYHPKHVAFLVLGRPVGVTIICIIYPPLFVFPGKLCSSIGIWSFQLFLTSDLQDLELLPDGDRTLIGDRGATLSVFVFRAVYQEADIYLLDDPLSAVDAEVGKHLFEQCICGLLKNKCRILVTHQLQYLRAADHILVLKEGHIMGQGTYKELQRSGLDVVSLLRTDEEQEQSRSADPEKMSLISQRTSLSHSSHCSNSSLLPPESNGPEQPVETVGAFEEENRAQGNVSCHIYLQYFTASCSLLVLILIVLLSVVAEAAYVLQDWWLVYWAREEYSNSTATAVSIKNGINVTRSELNLTFYLGIYSGLTGAAVVLSYARSLIIFHGLVRAAQILHNRMFNSVLCTPVHFFDVNPIGRILNRFSKDISQMDSMLPITFVDFYQLILQNAGVVAVAAAVIPLVLIPVVVLLIIFLYLRRFYLSTSRDIKRLESTTRSPVFSHLSSSLQGLWTIRAFRAEERLKKTFDAHQDLHSEAWFLFLMTSRWFSLCLDSICSTFVFFTTFACIILRDGLEAGEVGLVLTYAVTLVGNFQWTMRQSAEVENMMTSVERVVEYTQLQSEAPWETQRRPPPDWPSKGLVTFDQVSFSYSTDGPIILKDISATFHPNEKVGIVGRTGAGKSSLVSALFRLAEPQGKISIDGVVTSEIGLHDLRQKMSIIPQFLLRFSTPKSLVPASPCCRFSLNRPLRSPQVQLKSVVEELPGKLETVLAESGSNFSVGQRQLVCLARAILRKNRILIIDEATANVDPRTDELIQKTIRDKFRECTVLTIAHRLNTIIDSDRILVLDCGIIQEFDRPLTLLQNTEGALYKMVQQLGQAEAAALLQAARQVTELQPPVCPSAQPSYERSHLNPAAGRKARHRRGSPPHPEPEHEATVLFTHFRELLLDL